MRFINLLIIIVFILTSSCEKQFDLGISEQKGSLVVHGYIESGDVAQVDLTYEVPIVGRIDSSTILDIIETDALVYVSDGVNKEQLSLVRDDNRFPPIFYRGRSLKGVEGGDYKLEIVLDSINISAFTSIPNIGYLDSIFFERVDTAGHIVFRMKDSDKTINSYYRILTKQTESRLDYVPSLNYGVFTDDVLNNDTLNHIVYQGVSQFQTPFKDLFYSVNDSFDLKLCSMDYVSFSIWKIIHDEILNYGNPLHISNTPYQSNVNGANGVWTGYGVSRYRIYTW